VQIFSFTETITKVSNEFFQNLRQLNLNEDGLSLIKDEIKLQLRTKLNVAPAAEAYLDFINLMSKDYIDPNTIINEVDRITSEDFKTFFNEIFNSLYLRGFIHGTLSAEDSKKLFEHINNLFLNNVHGVIDDKSKNHLSTHSVLKGNYFYRKKIKDTQNVIHAVANFYRIGPYNIRNLISSNLIKDLCGNIYFTELRTKNQLGYIAKGKIIHEGDMLYYLIYVQGSVKTPDLMDEEIEKVVDLMKLMIRKVDENKFKSTLANVVKKIGKNDTSFKERTIRLWSEIIHMRYHYNLYQEVAKEAEKINVESLNETFFEIFKKLKKVSIQLFSSHSGNISSELNSLANSKKIIINDLNYFRNHPSKISLISAGNISKEKK